MARKNSASIGPIDCACVIHSDKYDWQYVEKLYNMLTRRSKRGIRFHVYTEHDRSVPPHMIKHCLEDWPGVSGPKKSWWYKLHLFNPEHHAGPLLYFDLDCVIVRDIDWIADLPSNKFWALKDFRYLQSPFVKKINSSIMWWDTTKFENVWTSFSQSNIIDTVKRFHGDQDYIEVMIDNDSRRYFNEKQFQSYRWEVADGGMDFRSRQPLAPGAGAKISGDCVAIVFHGDPKPDKVNDRQILQLWC